MNIWFLLDVSGCWRIISAMGECRGLRCLVDGNILILNVSLTYPVD